MIFTRLMGHVVFLNDFQRTSFDPCNSTYSVALSRSYPLARLEQGYSPRTANSYGYVAAPSGTVLAPRHICMKAALVLPFVPRIFTGHRFD